MKTSVYISSVRKLRKKLIHSYRTGSKKKIALCSKNLSQFIAKYRDEAYDNWLAAR